MRRRDRDEEDDEFFVPILAVEGIRHETLEGCLGRAALPAAMNGRRWAVGQAKEPSQINAIQD
jgi:hypothetical protein